MTCINTRLHCVVLLFFIATALFAVDTALFANLGFSEDGEVFVFAQYGVIQDKLFADIFFVDILKNEFLPGATRSAVYSVPLSAGQNGVSGLYTLLLESRDLIHEHEINHLYQGRLIYLAVSLEDNQEEFEFRDFEGEKKYRVQLHQSQQFYGTDVEAEFSITLQVADEQSKQKYIVGRPDYYRSGVSEYTIRQIILSPPETALIFVVDKIYATADAQRVRYMVETVGIQ